MLTIGSLFSGVGGLELGLEWAGLGPTIWQVEKDEFCRAVLAKHWPNVERFDDVCTVGRATLPPVDLICGGFPCQDVSSAGLRAGLAGERSGLWREFARILDELRPPHVVVENVASGAAKWVDAVVRELEKLGYDALPIPLSASDVGAPHRRARIFIVAHAHGVRELQPEGRVTEQRRRSQDATDVADSLRDDAQEQSWGSGGTHRARASEPGDDGALRPAPHVDREHGDARIVPVGDAATHAEPRSLDSVAPDALSARRQGARYSPVRRRGPSCGSWGTPESEVVPLVHGLSGGLVGRGRRARIRSLGNSVVPQQAEVIGWVVRELAGLGGAA